jgi:hypothetical protein
MRQLATWKDEYSLDVQDERRDPKSRVELAFKIPATG